MTSVYMPKQRELLRLWQTNKLKRINLLSGSVRSGKTWISLVLWAFWVATMPKEKNYLIIIGFDHNICHDRLRRRQGGFTGRYTADG